MFSLSKALQRGLARKNLNQVEFARIMIVTPQYISKLCLGKKEVSVQRLVWFAEFFGVRLSTFIGWGEYKDETNYLLGSKASRDRLMESIKQADE